MTFMSHVAAVFGSCLGRCSNRITYRIASSFTCTDPRAGLRNGGQALATDLRQVDAKIQIQYSLISAMSTLHILHVYCLLCFLQCCFCICDVFIYSEHRDIYKRLVYMLLVYLLVWLSAPRAWQLPAWSGPLRAPRGRGQTQRSGCSGWCRSSLTLLMWTAAAPSSALKEWSARGEVWRGRCGLRIS